MKKKEGEPCTSELDGLACELVGKHRKHRNKGVGWTDAALVRRAAEYEKKFEEFYKGFDKPFENKKEGK